MDGTSSESCLIATLILAVLKVWVPLPENELYIQWYGTASVSSVRFTFRLLHVNAYSDRFRWARVSTYKMYQCFETKQVNASDEMHVWERHCIWNNINNQLDATIKNFIDNYNRLNMFRAIISPILRSTRLCLQLVVQCTDGAACWWQGWGHQ